VPLRQAQDLRPILKEQLSALTSKADADCGPLDVRFVTKADIVAVPREIH